MIKAWAKENVGEKKKISTSILEIDNVSFSYDGVRETIKDLSFKVNKGEMLAIVGKNGAGKSTISKLLAGFIKEDRGRIVLNGRDLKDDTIFERGQKIGIVLQNPNQMICNNMIFDEVAFGLVNNEIPEDIIKQKVEQVLKVCGLYEFRNWPISALSYGQKKRVTIASILVMEPDIIVLDEPTAGQDYRHYTEIMDFLEELNDRGQTIIIITHDMHLMLEYCDRAIAILNGQKLFDGPCSELLSDEEIVSKANLKLTSLYDLALSLKIDPVVLTNAYISAERRSRNED